MGNEMKQASTLPIILTAGHYDEIALNKLKTEPIWRTVDIYERQLADVYEIQHPSLVGDASYKQGEAEFIRTQAGKNRNLAGDWVYFPWSGTLLHCVGSTEQLLLRTNRNQNLITSAEQTHLVNAKVAIAGMSVGGGIAVAMAYSGIASTMYLADFDLLETPNLNRVRAGLADIGSLKAEIVAHQIWEIHPSADLHLFLDGIDLANVDQFLGGEQLVDVVFDEIDDFKTKLNLRYASKNRRIPVVMLTALGDSVLVDVERYDLEPELPIFNGLIGDLESQIMDGLVTSDDAKRYAAQLVGLANVPTRAIESLLEMGRTLVGRPQLGSTVTLESAVASFIVSKIILGAPLASGRYRIDLNQLLGLDLETASTPERDRSIAKLLGPR
jgi:molybdopterin/thiamine biosynthesis adenylyltransferase